MATLDESSRLPVRLAGQRRAAQWAVLAVAQQIVRLDQGVQLAGALVDHGRLAVAQIALHGVVVGVAVRAMDLDRIQRLLGSQTAAS